MLSSEKHLSNLPGGSFMRSVLLMGVWILLVSVTLAAFLREINGWPDNLPTFRLSYFSKSQILGVWRLDWFIVTHWHQVEETPLQRLPQQNLAEAPKWNLAKKRSLQRRRLGMDWRWIYNRSPLLLPTCIHVASVISWSDNKNPSNFLLNLRNKNPTLIMSHPRRRSR